jgi:cytochrome P450
MSTDIPGTLLLDPDVIDDPYPFYRRLQAEAPVWRVSDTDVVAISTYPLIAEVASRVEDYSSHMRHLLYRGDAGLPERVPFGDAGADALATADPPRHKLHRDVVFSELVSKRMDALEPEVTAIADDCMAEVTDPTFDFMAIVGNVVPITVMTRLIGFRNAGRQDLFDAAVDSTSMLGATLSRAELDQRILRTLEIETWIGEQLSEEVENPGNDILGAVAQGVSDGVLTHQEGCVVLHTLLSAGGESTTSLIGNAVRILAERQDLQDLLRRSPTLIPAFFEEVLRLESPFRFLLRTASRDSTLAGVDIPSESTVLLLWGAANRDASTFQSPDEIVLDRKVPRRHVAFGRGIHHCVGAPLARLESRVVLSRFLAQTSKFSLDTNDRPEWVQSLMVRRHDRLILQASLGGEA